MPKKSLYLSINRYESAKLDMLPKMIQVMRSRGKKNIVTVRCIFIKISRVDTVNEQYYADIFIQAKWKEPHLKKEDMDGISEDISKYWNPKLYIENTCGDTKETISKEAVFFDGDESKGYIVEKHRIKGMFHETLELKQFPFDCQDLSVILTSELSYDDLNFMESTAEPSRLNVHTDVDSQEWDLHKHVDVTKTDLLSDCNVGPMRRPSIKFTCRASRRFGYFIINNFVISSLLCLLAFSSLAVPPNNTFGRLQLCMIILLTTVTFKVAVSQSLPKISYLTYLDKAILGNIIIIISLCIWHAIVSSTFEDIQTFNSTDNKSFPNQVLHDQVLLIRRREKILLIIFSSGYMGMVALFSLLIYFDAGARRRKMKVKDKLFIKKLEMNAKSSTKSHFSGSLTPY